MGASRSELTALAETRLEDARVLLAAERHGAAYYLAGYAVECGLKAVIAQSFRAAVIPDRNFVQKIHTHDLSALLVLAGLKSALDQRVRLDTMFEANWSFVSGWNEASRYEMIERQKAMMMLSAVGDPDNGVIAWLRSLW